eukprot:4380398-Pyramimonas_sp.AAC.1
MDPGRGSGPILSGLGFIPPSSPRLFPGVPTRSDPGAASNLQCRPMPRNTLLASRVPWVSWVSVVLLWKA